MKELKALGLWTEEMRNKIKLAEGSVQALTEIPEDVRTIYRTAWEIPMCVHDLLSLGRNNSG